MAASMPTQALGTFSFAWLRTEVHVSHLASAGAQLRFRRPPACHGSWPPPSAQPAWTCRGFLVLGTSLPSPRLSGFM